MSERAGFILGFDPGGETKKAFGWSVCETDGKKLCLLGSGTSRDALDAFKQANREIKKTTGSQRVLAAGIDAPMFYGSGGRRKVDEIISKKLPPDKRKSVVHVNSLRGACLVQGIVIARHLKRYKPEIKITEAHPTALYQLLKCKEKDGELNGFIERLKDKEHERDATIAAYAAWHIGCHRWRDLYKDEPCPVRLFDTPVSYWMPIERGSPASS